MQAEMVKSASIDIINNVYSIMYAYDFCVFCQYLCAQHRSVDMVCFVKIILI